MRATLREWLMAKMQGAGTSQPPEGEGTHLQPSEVRLQQRREATKQQRREANRQQRREAKKQEHREANKQQRREAKKQERGEAEQEERNAPGAPTGDSSTTAAAGPT